MEKSKKKDDGWVFVNCPACYSGNGFRLEGLDREIVCDDCGFVLAESPTLSIADTGRCMVCGGDKFYLEPALILRFLEPKLFCYVCETRYKGVKVNDPDVGCNEEVAAAAHQSAPAARLRERVERYEASNPFNQTRDRQAS